MLSTTKQYKKKLNGWLSYAFASEVFVIVSLTLFLPICLEQFARDNGFLLPDKTQPCVAAVQTNGTASAVDAEPGRCVVKIAWAWIDSASFSLYVYSISVALQALTVISMGGIADHPPHRKRLLLFFASLGASAATLFLLLPSSSPVWYLSAPLAMAANVGFGASVVAMNAYLPSLAREAPEVVQALRELHTAHDDDDDAHDEDTRADADTEHDPEPDSAHASAPLLHPATPTPDSVSHAALKSQYDALVSRTTARISSFGIALGYGAGIFALILALIPVTMLKGSTWALRLAIGLSGVWWGVFTIPAAVWLPGAGGAVVDAEWDEGEAEGEDERRGERGRRGREDEDKQWSMGREIGRAWVRLGDMLRWSEIKKLRNTFKYLGAWFLLSDGFTSLTSTAILFGKTTLHMSPSALVLVGALTPTAGIAGSLLWPYIQRRMGWSNQRVLVLLVFLAGALPAYGCLGFVVPGGAKFGGLTTQGEMFGLAVYFGSVYGAFQGYARAFYAELLPPGEEARWYGLFSITDKSSSFLGPLIVGVIADTTGNIRYAFFFLLAMVFSALPLLMSVDVERGRRDAQGYVQGR